MKRILARPTLLAGGLALLALCVLAHDAFFAPAEGFQAQADGGIVQLPPFVAAAAVPPPAVVYAEIAARPLFLPSRRAPAEAVGAAQAAALPPLDFTLVGVVTGPGQNMALVQQPGQAEAVLVQVGSVVDGWRVAKINRSGIEVQAGGTSSDLKIVR